MSITKPLRILISAIHWPVASGRYLERALKRLGHDVRTVGPSTGTGIWNMNVSPQWVWEPSYRPEEEDWTPDLWITADSHYAYNPQPTLTCPHICFGMDNHVRTYADLGLKFDAMFLAHSWGARMGEPNVYWTPPGYDPACHINWQRERPVDIGMMGFPYQERVEMISQFRAAGLNVTAGIGLVWDDYATFYNGVKIALVKSVMGDLTQRFLECMAMGCCVLADKMQDADKLNFQPGHDYLLYNDVADAINKARHALNQDTWKDHAILGQKKVGPHTWDARAATMLERMGL